MEKIQIIIEEALENTRLDRIVSMHRADVSRTELQKWIKEGYILVNGKTLKPNYRVSAGDQITIEEPEEAELIAEDLELDIVYEDEDVLVVNKRRGMVVHPAHAHTGGTLVNGLIHHTNTLSDVGGPLRPGIVHRTDKDTSGLLMVAKTNEAHESLVNQLVEKTVKRVYIALVHGHIAHSHGKIDAPIGRDEQQRQKMTVTDRGKNAVTHFKVFEQFEDYTLVECQLETGRTHQIRVHMEYIGHPLAGDTRYGRQHTLPFGGQVLHAKTLGFIHPSSKEYMEFTVAPPEDFQEIVNKVRNDIDK